MTKKTLRGVGGRTAAGQGGQSPRQAETSQGIILMSAVSAISKCRTEIRLGTGRKSASREAGSVVLRVVTPEGLGSFYFRWKSLPGAGLQACHVSTQEAVAGGSGIQGHFQLHSQFEASLSSYHGDFTDDKCEVENPNQTRSSLHDFTTSDLRVLVSGPRRKSGERAKEGGKHRFVYWAEGCCLLLLLFLLLSKDPGSAEVGKVVKEGQARARFSPGLGVLHD